MTLVIVLGGVLVTYLVMRRIGRRNTLAGLNQDRPAFSLAPPRRWSTTGKDHRL